MNPEQTILAEQIVAYALDKLRAVELQHEADPRLIFGELLGQLVTAEYKIQSGAKAEAQLVELIGAIWRGEPPADVDHAATVSRARAGADSEFLIETGAVTAIEGSPEAEEPAHFAGAVEGGEGDQ